MERRFGAALLDVCLYFLTLVPALFGKCMSNSGGLIPDEAAVLFGVSGALFVGLYALQCLMLVRRGQTIGKRMAKIKVVSTSCQPVGFVRIVLIRTVLVHALYLIPVWGQIFFVLDILWMVKARRRFLHDLMAKTIVIEHWD